MIDAARLATLKEFLGWGGEGGQFLDADERADLLAALDELERLRALLIKYEKSGKREGALMLHAGQVAADLATDRCRLIADNNCLKAENERWCKESHQQQARAEKAEAELEAQRPLIKAVMGARISGRNPAGVPTAFHEDDEYRVILAALAYREGART
jgi:multidrug resistance efflux pump